MGVDHESARAAVVAASELLIGQPPEVITGGVVYPEGRNPYLSYAAASSPTSACMIRLTALEITRCFPSISQVSAEHFPWHVLDFEHTAWIRKCLQEPRRVGRLDREITPKPSTVNTKLSILRGILRHCFKLRWIPAEKYLRAVSVENLSYSSLPAGRDIATAEQSLLFETCAEDKSDAGRRDAAIFAVLCGCGLRRSEVAALNLEDCSCETGEVRIIGAKNRKDRIVYLQSESGRRALSAWISVRGSRPGPLFLPLKNNGRAVFRSSHLSSQAVYSAVQNRRRSANLEPMSPHDFRRTFITTLLRQKADLFAVSDLAGHSDLKTTRKYDRRGEEAKKEAAMKIAIPYVDPD